MTFVRQVCRALDTASRAGAAIGKQRTAVRKKDGLLSIRAIRLSINFSVPSHGEKIKGRNNNLRILPGKQC